MGAVSELHGVSLDTMTPPPYQEYDPTRNVEAFQVVKQMPESWGPTIHNLPEINAALQEAPDERLHRIEVDGRLQSLDGTRTFHMNLPFYGSINDDHGSEHLMLWAKIPTSRGSLLRWVSLPTDGLILPGPSGFYVAHNRRHQSFVPFILSRQREDDGAITFSVLETSAAEATGTLGQLQRAADLFTNNNLPKFVPRRHPGSRGVIIGGQLV